jgi:hypothetical protein
VVETVTVEAAHGALGILAVGHGNEGKSLTNAWFFGRARNEDSLNTSERLEQNLQISISDSLAEIRNSQSRIVTFHR